MQKIKLLLFVFFSFVLVHEGIAQEKTITGTVSSKSDGGLLPGVSVLVQGTTKGTETDFDGNFSIKASVGDVLVFSFIGMKTKTVTVISTTTKLKVQLEDDDTVLDEVVVTALGVKKTRKSLTYAAQDIKAEELSKVKQTNPVNSLSGKVSGVVITKSSSGAGGSVKVTLRGNSSIGNNQPLYVIDGIPLSNPSSNQPTKSFGELQGGNRDGGDVLSLINPDDVESLTVLKGASASALYGSDGSNGVILITTKRGTSGNFKIDYSSNLTIDSAAYFLDFNNDAQSNVDDFLETGITAINSIAISGGTENAQTYFSYSNTAASGIMPTNTLKQHTFNIRETAQFFDNKLELNASVIGATQKTHNRAVSGLYFNPLVGVYNFDTTAGKLSDYANFEELDPSRNIMSQRWFRATSDVEQNPYWIQHRNAHEDSNEKLLSALNLTYKVNDWLSIQARGTFDKTIIGFNKKIYATTNATLAPSTGRYIKIGYDYTQTYADLLANINKKLNNDFNLSVISGISTKNLNTGVNIADSGENGGLQFANVFSVQNFNANASVEFSESYLQIRTNSIFASATIGYQDKLFLDLTARNDWSSTVPDPFFYPSVGLTGVLSELFDLGEKVSFAKMRVSYAEVGNGFGADQISPNREILFGGGVSAVDPVRPFPGTTPKPERQRSFEIGTEWKFLNNRIGIDLGYYNTSTINQYFRVPVSTTIVSSGVAGINAGDIVNKGIEASVYAIPVQNDDFKWTTTLNFASNKNEILSISDDSVQGLIPTDFFTISAKGVNTFGSYLVKGGSFGDIYAQEIKRNSEGIPIYDSGAFVRNNENEVDGLTKVGNANPDFTLGWNNSFEYKNLSIDFLIDGKFGGETMSLTEAIVEGASNNTNRETTNANVTVVDLAGNKSTLTAQEYYGKVGGRNGFSGEFVYSATNIRLAELAIGYNFSLPENSFFKKIKASAVGNNLFFFYKDAPHDPNVSISTGNALQGVDVFGLPSSRSFGLNLNLTF